MAENSPMGKKGMLCISFWVFKAFLFWIDSDLNSDSETYVILERFLKMYFLKNKTFFLLIFPGLTRSQCFSNSVNSNNGSDWMSLKFGWTLYLWLYFLCSWRWNLTYNRFFTIWLGGKSFHHCSLVMHWIVTFAPLYGYECTWKGPLEKYLGSLF